MKRLRLCFVGWADHVHLERWAGYFADAGHDVTVISFSALGRYPAGVRQFKLGMKGRGERWVRLRLRYLLWLIKPEIVHVHWAHFAVPVRAVWHGPMAVTAWGSDIYKRDAYSDTDWNALGRALRQTPLITCDSEDLATTMRKVFDLNPRSMHVIQWGVDTEQFQFEGSNLRDKLGLHGRAVVFSARNFTPLYNQETVLQAFAIVRESRPDAFLLMKTYAGDPAYLARIRKQIEQMGLDQHVAILDAVPYEDMPALYRTANVTVSVPLSDATPMSLFEAMAAGSPCVFCDLPSLREWISHGESGYLVAARDKDALASAICLAMQPGADRNRMINTARQLVVSKASQHAHMQKAAKCYELLCQENSRLDSKPAGKH